MAADNITLDLGGHAVFGTQTLTGSRGQVPGIRLDGTHGSTVRNGEVRNFNAGIELKSGSGNTVRDLNVHDNFGGGGTGKLGDGIAIVKSSDNQVLSNTVQHNGPFSGIALVFASSGNLIDGNRVLANDVADYENGVPVWQEVMGIRVEGPGAVDDTLSNNEVAGSGRQGINILSTCKSEKSSDGCGAPANTGNVLSGNYVHHNGVGTYLTSAGATRTTPSDGILFMVMGPTGAGSGTRSQTCSHY